MGADIWGWVEVEEILPGYTDYGPWQGIIQIRNLRLRSYFMFGSLFGWREGYGFRPVVPGRGAPADMSDEYLQTREGREGTRTGETWMLGSELVAVDWEEEGEAYLDEVSDSVVWEPGPGVRHLRRKDVVVAGWQLLIEFIERLGQEYGPEHVRLLVYFDMA